MNKRKTSLLFLIGAFLCCCTATGAFSLRTVAAEPVYKETVVTHIGAPKLSGKNVAITIDFSEKIADKQYADMEQRTKGAFATYLPAGFKLTAGEIDALYNGGLITAEKPNSVLNTLLFGCPEYNKSLNMDTGGFLTSSGNEGDIKLFTMEQIQRKAPAQSVFSVQIHYVQNSIQFYFKGGDPQGAWNIAPELNQEMVIRIKAGLVFPTGVAVKEDVTYKYYPELNEWKDITFGEYFSVDFVDDTLNNQAGYTDKEIELMAKA